jgi:hypothetical protein
MAHIVRKWKRIVAVGCSHGAYIDDVAANAILTFVGAFKPHCVVHLGDFCDMTAFRSQARGTADEAAPIHPDIERGLGFLEEIKANCVFCGNHEARLFKLADHYNSIVAELAGNVIREIEKTCHKLHAELIPYNILRGHRIIGGYRYLHGYFFNELAARDHAETFGNCVFAHTHSVCEARGRRIDMPRALCVGTLARIPNLDYALQRRKTLSWSQGFVWGEYCDNESMLWLHDNGQNLDSRTWRLPIV